MKWVLITHDYPPKMGGVARYLKALVDTCECIELEQLQRLPNRIGLLWFVYNRMRSSDGVVTSHVLPIGTMCWLASKITKKPYIVILHGMDFDLARRTSWKRWILRKILKNAKTIITNSKALDREVSNFTHRMDIEVVYPTVTDAFIEGANFIYAKHQVSDRIRLLTVARLVDRKGHMKVLELVKDDTSLSYTIVGDGEMKSKIVEFIELNKLEDRVEILSSVQDRKLPDLYAKSDIFVMPTSKSKGDREGFGIVYIEAQLFQVPVIATNHPGVDEAIRDNETGFLIEDSLDSLEIAIEKLRDPEVRKKMGSEGIKFVKSNFTREKQFKKFCKILGCG